MAAGATIKHKRRAGIFSAGQLVAGEVGVDTANGQLWFSFASGSDPVRVMRSDEPVTTPAANGIPRADGAGLIARGWYGNVSTGESAFAYGASHDASGDYSGCFGGGNSVTADYAFAAGSSISATAKGAFGSGIGAEAKVAGMRAHSSGLQPQGGVSQVVEATLTGTSVPGGEDIELFLDGIAERLVVGNNRMLNVLVFVTGCTIGGGSWVRNCRQLAVRRDSTYGLQFVGEQFIIGANYQSDRVTIGLDQFNNALTINVSGFTGEVTSWSAMIHGGELGVYESYFWAPG